MTTAITKAQAQAQLTALLAAQSEQTLTVRFADRSVTYRTATEIISLVNYWSRVLSTIERREAGRSRHGARLADFRAGL